MDDVKSMLPQPHDHPLIRRRSPIPSPIVVAPTKLNLHHHHHSSSSTTTSSSSNDLELLSIKPYSHSYTSLKDLLPTAAVNSPRPNSAPLIGQGGSDICIRNRLVKQAAWAYLQPMSASPCSAEGSFLRRIWPRLAALFDLVHRSVVRFLDWALSVVRIRGSR